jgi:thiamine-monophosphate kinase
MQLDEKRIIQLFISKLKKNNLKDFEQDDVTVIPSRTLMKFSSHALVFKCDMLVESTDVPPGMEPWQVARKSVVSVISDLSAKGAKPYVSLISVGIPKAYSKKAIASLVEGFRVASREFGFIIVGGDTNQAKELIIDCCVVGFSHRIDLKVPSRSGARPGDFIIVSGIFGYPSAGLKILMDRAVAKGDFRKKAIASVIMPLPRIRFGTLLAKFFSSSIDSSDGLALSLYELAGQSNVDFFVNEIPYGLDLLDFVKNNNLNSKELIFHGGEEYEIIATIPRAALDQAKTYAKKSRIKFLIIGEVKKGSGNVFIKSEEGRGYSILENRGYTHLSRSSPS